MEDIPGDGVTPVIPPEDAHGYEIIGHRLVYYGYCPACKARLSQDE
jgi:Fe2+ or Zn2+ uptake regulation protein